jgi:hypothetical protein
LGDTQSHCNRLISNYIEEVNVYKKNMVKNFEDMDFKNAVTRNEFGEIVDEMINNCDSLIMKLQEYTFD